MKHEDSDALSKLITKLREHTKLDKQDITEIRGLTAVSRLFSDGDDIVRQGDRPNMSAVVVTGMLARYQVLANGRRQYLFFHIAGDMPDSQCLFIDQMDHSVCAIGSAVVATIAHAELEKAFVRRPSFAFAIWRETLIDAAIFREAITNNSARSASARMAHLFCEIFYRAKSSGLTIGDSCSMPVTLTQLGETLGLSLATVNRALSFLRQERLADLRNGSVVAINWDALREHGEFDHRYLHLLRPLS
jgi:CRP-like cAMP-binding protein